MFGSLRLGLATLVVMSHLHARFFGLDEGTFAVTVFYILSGYVMTGLLRRHYTTFASIPDFFIDRICRIYPQFLLWLLITAMLVFGFGYRGFFVQAPHFRYLINYLFILPLGFVPQNGFYILPQAWSLGIEAAFYITIPFILLYRWRTFAAYMSAFLFFSASITHTDYLFDTVYQIHSFPQAFFIFLTGSIAYDNHKRLAKTLYAPIAITIALLLLSPVVHLREASIEVCLGYLYGTAALHVLANAKRKKADDMLGEYSYGVFMSHIPLIFFMEKYRAFTFDPEQHKFLFIATCFAASVLSFHLIEKPFLNLRHQIRHKMRAPQSN